MSSRNYGENFASIRQAVAEKSTNVLCGQTNKDRQTDGQTNKQTNGPKRNTLSYGEDNKLTKLLSVGLNRLVRNKM